MIREFNDKVILVTGGAGSIGSALVREILKYNPKTVRILDSHEFSLHKMENSLPETDRSRVRFLLGDVKDKDRLQRAMNGVDIVYHAAAYKHVHLCDYNPLEAIKTNVIGTQNAIDAALHNGVKKFIFISTDKAVNPIGTLGASKLLGEKIVTAANYYKGNSPTIFSSVRFGNVTMSNGSVIPSFLKQMRANQPLTVTSSKMTRFLMPMEKAVNLIFRATEIMNGEEVFVLKMKSINIKDLAIGLAEEYTFINGGNTKKVAIKQIGRRAGEKIHEQLIVEEESHRVVELEDMLIVMPSVDPVYPKIHNPLLDKAKKVNTRMFSSEYKPMSQKQLKNFLRENKIINGEKHNE
jgi:UDP-N-acetylglucosamine 4,6-dehydratase/5-epimerase